MQDTYFNIVTCSPALPPAHGKQKSGPQSRQVSRGRTDFSIVWNVNTKWQGHVYFTTISDASLQKTDSGYAIKSRQQSSDSKAEKHTADLPRVTKQKQNKTKKPHPKQFSSIHKCPGTRQLLVMPIWSTTCRDGQLMLFGPHGTHEGFNWGSHPGGLPCTGASRSSESLTAGESTCTTGLPSEPALGGGYHERLWARPPANCFSNSYALSL